MKIYSLSYDHIGGRMDIQTENIFELAQKLEKALDDKYVTQVSIKIDTQEVK